MASCMPCRPRDKRSPSRSAQRLPSAAHPGCRGAASGGLPALYALPMSLSLPAWRSRRYFCVSGTAPFQSAGGVLSTN